ncbi:HD-GYP domain-containing protein [Marinitoga lauensis]|uniref:HD-GYP domain-containing protein n=1 Tax=Marinitoga lauensis TaxID=2201189 RepID=UPI00197EFDD8|nr:HD-GYP domain-containing protein [Marinitoga lauensis]
MKKNKITLYQLISKNIMTIVLTGIIAVLVVITTISYLNFKRIEDSFRENAKQLVSITFNSLYSAIYDFDARYYKGLDMFIEYLKTDQENLDKKIMDFMYVNKRLGEEATITKVEMKNLDLKIQNKLKKLKNFDYFIELDLTPKNLIRNVYLRLNDNFYMLKTLLPIGKIESIINNLSLLKEKYDFIKDINICTHSFEGLSDKFPELNEEDTEYLKKAFDTEKEVIIEKRTGINFYSIWKYEDEKTLFRPIGIVLKLDFSKFKMSIFINFLMFIIALGFILYIISKKAHKVSRQISKPFEIMLDNMKKFQETRYLEFDKIMEKCDIKEINELMTEYQKMTEDIMSSFEEINAMNEELESSYKEIEKVNNELEEAYLNFSTQLSIIAEGYDETTGNHVNRVGELSAFIAQKMGVKEETVEKIRYYAPLHDIGKIMIPKEILEKKGRLTEEEFEIMKKHTLYGSLLIGESPKFEIARNIALYHHEKYNGKGYPYGLNGEEIPLCAAIVSVVDVYDALRSERPYKPAFSHEKTMDIIINGDDRTNPEDFHPEVLKILKEHEFEIKELWEKVNQNSSRLIELLKEIEKSKE